MGYARWNPEDWKSYSSRTTAGRKTAEIYMSKVMNSTLDPKDAKTRESRDSALNPVSNAVIIALDVTGSMSPVLDYVIRDGLNKLFTDIYALKPVPDPHVMLMGIGDVTAGDKAPLQVTQFEADIRIAEQLKEIYLEQGGGGNMFESYALAWYFAGMRTSIDCFEKRNKKGYLFTVGDELPTPSLTREEIKIVTGDSPERNLTGIEMLEMATRQYEVYHVLIQQGSNYRALLRKADLGWAEILGQRVLLLSDVKMLAETIIAAIALNEGLSKEKILESWDHSTAMIVSEATRNLTVSANAAGGVVTL